MKSVIPEVNSKSMDIVADNISKLKELFPEAFTEGKVDFDALKEVLGDYIDGREERYSFTWNGKSKARMLAQTPSTGTLRPCKDESVDWDSTQNLFIEGDNLEVLKLLQKSYHKKVKMIYIDPPYNTGSDFVYKDNFKDNIKNYKEITGQVDSEGRSLSNNPETSGRYHTDWLNMIYPRLKLARNLLTDDGVIFISIGEQEVHNLRKLADEVFGEENFIGGAGRISKKANNQGDYWAPNFDHVLTYCKAREFCTPFFGGINYSNYTEIETDGPRAGEKFQPIRLYMTSLDPMRGCNNQRYYIECPDGSYVIPPGENFPENVEDGAFIPPKNGNDKVWRWSYKSYLEKKDQLVIRRVKSSNLVDQNGEPAKWNVYTKTYLNDVIENSSATPNNFIEEHINQKSSHELKSLGVPFDFAKPSSLIKFLAKTCCVKNDDIVLDFFAGSATTAHSVLELNLEDNLTCKFILVQLPELLDDTPKKEKDNRDSIEFLKKNGLPIKLSEIGKIRIRRVIEKIKSEQPEYNGDLGFKVFKLDSTNIKPWELDFDLTEQDLEDQISNIKHGREDVDVLYEVLLKYGLDLTLPITEHVVVGHKVFDIGMGALMICLSNDITLDVVEGIAKLKDELNPEIMRVVFKDAGFADDVVKTNAVQILKQAGIEDVRSL